MTNPVPLNPSQLLNNTAKVELPKVNIDNFNDYPVCYKEYCLPINFIKFNEKTCEELDEEIEYDMDVEDNVWLKIINEQRENDQEVKDKTPIMQEQFEFLMDRLEKDSYFQPASHSPQKNSSINQSLNSSRAHNDSSSEDAFCCICLDGECSNSNVILFCDMCNLAVHQECYGVPYIPEGQWLCRKCIQSPSAPVNCILCPNKFGAFKQTDHNEWAHVVCAIWIPEVHFANTVFLEPIVGSENIDRARWKLMCYICRKRNVGACIQCDKQNCYTAFHVTCAQQAGLYMNIEEECVENEPPNRSRKKNNKNSDANSSSSVVTEVRKCAFCDIHTPLDVLSPTTGKSLSSMVPGSYEYKEAVKQAQKTRMKKARKILAEQRKTAPMVCLPVITKEKIETILSNVEFDCKEKFMDKLVKYWLLKRYARNGVPILRRLQNMGTLKKKNEDSRNKLDTSFDDEKKSELIEKLTKWKKIRQDLEKARLLMELIRKRERLKRDLVRIDQLKTVYELNPFNGLFLQRILDIIVSYDTKMIFTQPVDPVEVPIYYEFIKNPMDLSIMQKKIDNFEYETFEQFEADFDLMINNCFLFNAKNNYFYKAGVKLKEQAMTIFKNAKKLCENILNAQDFFDMIINSGVNEEFIKQIEEQKPKEINKNPTNEIKNKSKTCTPSTSNKRQAKTATPRTNTSTRSRQPASRKSAEKSPPHEKISAENFKLIEKGENKINLENQSETPLKANLKPSRKSLRINPDLLSITETRREEDKNSDDSINDSTSDNEKNDSNVSDESQRRKRNRVSMKELKGLEMWSAPFSPNKRLKHINSTELNKSEMNDEDLDTNSMRVETDDLDQTVDDKSRTKIGSSRKSLTKKDSKIELNEGEMKKDAENDSQDNSRMGVNRRSSILFKRKNKKNSKNDSVSDISANDSNNKDLMNISGSSNQTNESN